MVMEWQQIMMLSPWSDMMGMCVWLGRADWYTAVQVYLLCTSSQRIVPLKVGKVYFKQRKLPL